MLSHLDPNTYERTEGPTPNGGTYAVAFFRDLKGNPCSRENAVGIEVIEYDAAGKAFFRTYMERITEEEQEPF